MKKTEVKKEKNMQEISLLEMLKCGVHFGHQKKNWHPKMKPYIYTTRAGLCIIDLEKTAAKLNEALHFLQTVVANGGQILFVATKRQAQAIIQSAAKELGMPYISNRWIGGMLTNFDIIIKMVKRLQNLRRQKEKGELAKYTKKEQLKFSEEIVELEKIVGGIEGMTKLPQAMFVVDLKKEKTAIREATNKKIPIVGIVDTNNNPDLADYPIPANDDATKSIKFIVGAVVEAIKSVPKNTAEPKVQSENKPAKK